MKAEGRNAAKRGNRLRIVIWISEFLLLLHFNTHWHTWERKDTGLAEEREVWGMGKKEKAFCHLPDQISLPSSPCNSGFPPKWIW